MSENIDLSECEALSACLMVIARLPEHADPLKASQEWSASQREMDKVQLQEGAEKSFLHLSQEKRDSW